MTSLGTVKLAGSSIKDRVRSSVNQEGLGVEPLRLHIKRSQLRWLGHPFRMPLGCLQKGTNQARWTALMSQLALEHLGLTSAELKDVSAGSVYRDRCPCDLVVDETGDDK